MPELLGFTKEERIIFGLDIVDLERNNKDSTTARQINSFKKKKEKLKQQRLDFLESLEK